MTAAGWLAPGLDDIERLAAEAYAQIPAALRAHVADVMIRVVDFPDEETEAEMGLESPFDLLGLYVGVSLDQKSTLHTPSGPDVIYLYRRPILDYWCDSDQDLAMIIRHVLIHEIGHHFGFSDADMDALEAQA